MRRGHRRLPFLTIGVWCSWLHSANCKLSIIALVSAFFVCVWILHVSEDIWRFFLMFAVNSLRVGRRWQSANIIAKMHPKCINNQAHIHQFSSQIHAKSTKGMPRNVPKGYLDTNLFQQWRKGAAYLMFFCILGATWPILVAIWCPARRQGGPKIEHLGVKACPKPQK